MFIFFTFVYLLKVNLLNPFYTVCKFISSLGNYCIFLIVHSFLAFSCLFYISVFQFCTISLVGKYFDLCGCPRASSEQSIVPVSR